MLWVGKVGIGEFDAVKLGAGLWGVVVVFFAEF